MKVYHNSQDPAYRSPKGAVAAGTRVALSLTAEGACPILSCRLHLFPDGADTDPVLMNGVRRSGLSQLFSIETAASASPALCWYYFSVTDESGQTWYYGNNSQRLGGEGALYDHVPPPFQITVYTPSPVPDWYTQSIIYQIFPDRFARDGNWLARQAAAGAEPTTEGAAFRLIQQDWHDQPFYCRNRSGEVTRWPFFGGSLEGIRSRLFYLKSLGVGAIYLNPIFSARSNHKYDTADYLRIDPAFGCWEDFSRLSRDSERLGIRLILDGVFNHTGSDSRYFNRFGHYRQPGACQGPESVYYNWYCFTRFPDEYACWWGVADLPAVNKDDVSYQEFIFGGRDSVIRRWLAAGASGWRLDVADELPDAFISGIKKAMREADPQSVLIGEVWEDASNKVSYGQRRRYLLGEELDSAMNYPLRGLLLDYICGRCSAESAVRQLFCLAENYPPENFRAAFNLIGSHDQPRILTLLGDAPQKLPDMEKEQYRLPEDKYALAKQRLKLMSLLQFILPGVPAIYYGDEAGCQGYEDPYNRGTYPWGREDRKLLAHYRMLAALRKQYPFLADGDYHFSWEGEHVFICARYEHGTSRRLLLLVNRHIFGDVSFRLPLPKDTGYVLELLNSHAFDPKEGALSVHLPPLSAMLLDCRRNPPGTLSLKRGAGVLCHVSSLPSGKMDLEAEGFIDWLADCGLNLWQILPLNPPGWEGDSPYSSPAVFAGDDRLLGEDCTLTWECYEEFCREEAFWLEDYALYCVLKEEFSGLPWQKWPQPERDRTNLDQWKHSASRRLEAVRRRQFRFWSQWDGIRAYANQKGIAIIGDLPICAGTDSADTWAHREWFLLGEDNLPLAYWGVPADAFCPDGQNWKNPLYDWDRMKKDGYSWWHQRISQAMKHYDYIRCDHFRGFCAFYAIPPGKKAQEGVWLPGPGEELFRCLTERLGQLPILAEDLGFLDSQVKNLLQLCGYPGMMVYQFSKDEMLAMSNERASKKVFYTGTHDNPSLTAWCAENTTQPRGSDAIIESLYKGNGAWVITPLQDLLGLGDESRMNVPGRPRGNWAWRGKASQLTKELAEKIHRWVSDSGR